MINFGKLQENDILHIPGDTGGTWRIEKFLEFQHKATVVDHTLLVGYSKRHKLTPDEIVLLFWLLSSTYSEISAIFLFNDIKSHRGWDKVDKEYIDQYWKDNKPRLQFGSARRYAKNMDWFPVLITNFLDMTKYKPYKWLTKLTKGMTPEESYSHLYKVLMGMKFMGRFSVELFLMNFRYFYLEGLLDVNIEENVTFNWREYSNETSGLLNLFYKDESANEFDKSKKITAEDCKFLDEAVHILRDMVYERYGEREALYLMFMPRICVFRNFCKGMRYVGFHHDRQLGFIREYESNYPENDLWEELYEIRFDIFPHELLGELNGWTGIRPEKKKMFLTTGLTGAECIKEV